jgi:hypothetical protein
MMGQWRRRVKSSKSEEFSRLGLTGRAAAREVFLTGRQGFDWSLE